MHVLDTHHRASLRVRVKRTTIADHSRFQHCASALRCRGNKKKTKKPVCMLVIVRKKNHSSVSYFIMCDLKVQTKCDVYVTNLHLLIPLGVITGGLLTPPAKPPNITLVPLDSISIPKLSGLKELWLSRVTQNPHLYGIVCY